MIALELDLVIGSVSFKYSCTESFSRRTVLFVYIKY